MCTYTTIYIFISIINFKRKKADSSQDEFCWVSWCFALLLQNWTPIVMTFAHHWVCNVNYIHTLTEPVFVYDDHPYECWPLYSNLVITSARLIPRITKARPQACPLDVEMISHMNGIFYTYAAILLPLCCPLYDMTNARDSDRGSQLNGTCTLCNRPHKRRTNCIDACVDGHGRVSSHCSAQRDGRALYAELTRVLCRRSRIAFMEERSIQFGRSPCMMTSRRAQCVWGPSITSDECTACIIIALYSMHTVHHSKAEILRVVKW